MLMLGCKPDGRVTEQHDIFFGIANNLKELIPRIKAFWPEAEGKIHIDVWREVTAVDNYSIEIIENQDELPTENNLYFLNLGGYKAGDFEEYHYRMLAVAPEMSSAIKQAKKTTFYKHFGFKGATSHIDEKYGIDVDDSHKVGDLLDSETKVKYQIRITASAVPLVEDELHISYLTLKAIK